MFHAALELVCRQHLNAREYSEIFRSQENKLREDLAAAYPRLWRFALSLAGKADQAEDLANATALRALEKAHLFEPGTRFDSWLFKMAQNLWFNERRAQAVRKGQGLVAIEETELPSAEPGAEANILRREVLYKVMMLPEAQRATVTLVYIEGYKYVEAADILGIPVGTIMSRLASARATLARELSSTKGAAE